MRNVTLWIRMVIITGLFFLMADLGSAQDPMTFDQAIQEGQSFGNAQPKGKDAANTLIDNARNQGIPGLTPQSQSNAEALGNFYIDNPGQLRPQGEGVISATEGGQFLEGSYNLRPRYQINPDDPLVVLGDQAASGNEGCITQRVCTQTISEVVTTTQEFTCSLEYAEAPGQCTYALPQPTIVSGSGSGSLCVDHYLYSRIYQENATTYHLQLLDTGPSGSLHWNCGGPGSGGGIGDWHTIKIVTLPEPPSTLNFCVTASGSGCGATATPCVSTPGQAVSVLTCGSRGAQSPSYTYDYSFVIPAPPVSPETIQAACGAYMNSNCTLVNEQCTSAECTRSYLCVDQTVEIDACAPYKNQGCTLKESACAITNTYGQCISWQETYTCITQTVQEGCAAESVQVICPQAPSGIRCLDDPDACADTTSIPSQDLALATSNMEGLNAVEDDHTTDPLVVFTGDDQFCRKTIASGITRDCCALDTLLLNCNSAEELLQTRRNEGQCVQIGTYCSERVNLVFTSVCVERSTAFCCFSSKLVRIIQEQGRPQLGIGWGTPQNPDCRGFTPEELQQINFEAIDFSEYYSDITANPPDPNQLTNQVQGSGALTPDPNSVPSAPGGISPGQVQQDLNLFYGTHAP